MTNIAIIEDEITALNVLQEYIKRFEKEWNEKINYTYFPDAISFLTGYKANYDIVFMDIELPNLNGMEAARKLVKLDQNVVLIFVTNMAQYAVKGYEVNAFDFIVKPVSYYDFALKLQRALDKIANNVEIKINVSVDDGKRCIPVSQIRYVEVVSHQIIYHLAKEKVTAYGTLKKVEEMLPKEMFAKCNNCYLVNLRHVVSVQGYTLDVEGEELQISHPKKKAFLTALNSFLGGD